MTADTDHLDAAKRQLRLTLTSGNPDALSALRWACAVRIAEELVQENIRSLAEAVMQGIPAVKDAESEDLVEELFSHINQDDPDIEEIDEVMSSTAEAMARFIAAKAAEATWGKQLPPRRPLKKED